MLYNVQVHKASRYDSLDKYYVTHMANSWKEKYPEDYFHYRPMTNQDDVNTLEHN